MAQQAVRILGAAGDVTAGDELRGELLAIERGARSRYRLSTKFWRVGRKHERKVCVRRGSRKLRMRRSPFSSRLMAVLRGLFTRAQAFTNTCFTCASSDISAFAAG